VKTLIVLLALSLSAQGQPSGEASRLDDLQKQVAIQGKEIEKRFDLQREELNKQIDALSHRELVSAIPTLLWCILLSGIIFAFRLDIRQILRLLVARLQQGSSVKLGSIEIGAVIAIPARMEKADASRAARRDDGRRKAEREEYYERSRRVMLVHRLSPSTEEGELYDILIYVIPALRGSVSGVAQVEYFFGGHGWGDRIFTATDRSRGFPVLTAAYGPFLCTANVIFTDGSSMILHRYIDFEMGNLITSTNEATK
jgi:hypothetical protein